MLHLLARGEEVVSRRRRRGRPDAVAPAKRGQSRIGHGGAEAGERVVHTPQVPLVAGVELQYLLAPRFGEFRTHHQRHGTATGLDDPAHRVARDPQRPRDLAAAVAFARAGAGSPCGCLRRSWLSLPFEALHQALHLAVRARERGADLVQFALLQLREQAALEGTVGATRDAPKAPRSAGSVASPTAAATRALLAPADKSAGSARSARACASCRLASLSTARRLVGTWA